MTDYEIVQSYKWAKCPEQQIDILCELTLKPRWRIIEILEKNGVYEDMANRMEWTPEADRKLLELKGGGEKNSTIAEIIGCTEIAVCSRYNKIKPRESKSIPVTAPEKATSPTTTPTPQMEAIPTRESEIALNNALFALNPRLSAVTQLIRLTHEDGANGAEDDYYTTAGKYELLIPLLEAIVREYELLC